MIEPLFIGTRKPGTLRHPTDSTRVINQIASGRVRADPAAAREIAQRIEEEGGFWDFEKKRQEQVDNQSLSS